ncbi:MAG: myo-inosose-2 dehydratase [Albidovulum sp.]|nr:myo-inosose-2 dehydratase [Albidovulum sp.]
MKAILGIAPIAWSNDDLPELGGETTLETCLSDARRAGFSGVETGGKFPKSSAELGPILDAHDLRLCGGWYSGTVLDKDLEEEKDQAAEQLELFRDLNAPCLVYGETSGTIQNVRDAPLDGRRKLDGDQFREYGRKLTSFCEWCADEGMTIAFHHHMATAVETEDDIDALMNNTGAAVGLLLDPGHLAFARGNILETVRKHASRICHVHAKDVRSEVIESLDRSRESFLDAVLKGAFTVPGDGSLDYRAIVQALADSGYEGWFVVEAEQDPELAPPAEYAAIGYRALSQAVVAAGYSVEE